MALSKEKMIEIVIDRKERIVKTTNQISEKLQQLRDNSLDDEAVLFLKKGIHQVVSDLSIIGGFCGRSEKSYINRASHSLATLVAAGYIDIMFASFIELWCIMINGVIVDFTKTPFRFVGGEFKLKLKEFETKIKAFLSREQVSQRS